MPSTYTPIATQTITTPTTSLTFSSIPSIYTDLIAVVSCGTSLLDGNPSLNFRLNGDTGTNYSLTQIFNTGSGRSTSQTSGQTGNMPGTTGSFTTIVTHFMNYSNTTTNKTVLARGDNANNFVIGRVNLWRNTSAITSIIFLEGSGNNLLAGSTFTLYGIKAA